jgi:A/G-specific adenine glycosylase
MPMQPPWEDPDVRSDARTALITWYEEHQRAFPWRETTDPYPILICEVMSQQTQLSRVEPAYEAFLRRWPTIADLAASSTDAVVRFWTTHALGYNRRARYLHAAAQQILEEFDGAVPSDPQTLQTLPGVGPYTASAVAAFAYNTQTAVLDTNVRRVLHRLGPPDPDRDEAAVAEQLLPAGHARVWNNAIMELGSQVCTPTPRCEVAACPLRHWCHAYRTGDFSTPSTPSQPTFAGSRRQLRGQIVNILATEGPTSRSELRVALRARDIDTPDEGRMEEALASLQDDRLIRRVGGRYQVS